MAVGLGEPLLEVLPLVVQVDLDESGGREADEAKGQGQRKIHFVSFKTSLKNSEENLSDDVDRIGVVLNTGPGTKKIWILSPGAEKNGADSCLLDSRVSTITGCYKVVNQKQC